MNRSHSRFGAIMALCWGLTYAQGAQAQEFTGTDFLRWEVRSQDAFIENALGMAAIIMAQTSKPQIGTCIDNWYFTSEALSAQRNGEIRARIAEFSTFHPHGVITAFIKKQCGSLP